MDPAKRHAAEVGNDIDAQMSGIGRSGLSPDDQRRAKMGAFNAPPPRALPLQPGTIHRKDGSTTAGFFDPSSGEHYDVNYQFVDDAVRFERGNGGTSSASSGGKWSVEKDSKSSTGWRQVHRDAAGAVLGQGGEAAAPGGPPSFSFLPTPGGIVTGNNRTGAVAPAAGGEGVQRPAAPGTDLNALREIEASILRLHKRPEGFGAGLSPAPAKMQAWRASLDEEAKKYNYPDFAALQAAMGGAATNVGDVTPPPQVPPGLGAKPVPKGTKDKANTGKGKIDVNAILGELAKARKGVATAPAPPK